MQATGSSIKGSALYPKYSKVRVMVWGPNLKAILANYPSILNHISLDVRTFSESRLKAECLMLNGGTTELISLLRFVREGLSRG